MNGGDSDKYRIGARQTDSDTRPATFHLQLFTGEINPFGAFTIRADVIKPALSWAQLHQHFPFFSECFISVGIPVKNSGFGYFYDIFYRKQLGHWGVFPVEKQYNPARKIPGLFLHESSHTAPAGIALTFYRAYVDQRCAKAGRPRTGSLSFLSDSPAVSATSMELMKTVGSTRYARSSICGRKEGERGKAIFDDRFVLVITDFT